MLRSWCLRSCHLQVICGNMQVITLCPTPLQGVLIPLPTPCFQYCDGSRANSGLKKMCRVVVLTVRANSILTELLLVRKSLMSQSNFKHCWMYSSPAKV